MEKFGAAVAVACLPACRRQGFNNKVLCNMQALKIKCCFGQLAPVAALPCSNKVAKRKSEKRAERYCLAWVVRFK